MNQSLPQNHVKTEILFPRNLRFITEYTFSEAQSRNIKVGLVSITSLFLLALIFLQGMTLWVNLKQQETLQQERRQVQNNIAYWESVAARYQGYRDVYYRIAALEYKLGNISESQKYVKKALELDPNFPEGRVLGAKIGL
jgi:tetratricopeptide (TPR) repeat protein